MMRKEYRQPTKAELKRITSRQPVVRRIRPEELTKIAAKLGISVIDAKRLLEAVSKKSEEEAA